MAKPGRLYVPLDVSFFDGDGAELSDDAQLLFLRILARLKTRNSDAWITSAQVKMWGRSLDGTVADAIDELANSPLVEEVDGRYFVVPWDSWRLESEDAEDSGAYGNHVRWHVDRGIVKEGCRWCESPPSSGANRPDIAPISPPESQPDRSSKQSSNQAIKGSDPDPIEVDFDEVWSIWPKRQDARKPGLTAYRARRKEGVPHEQLLAATRNFVAAMCAERRDNSKIMNCSTFFGPNERWSPYLLAPVVPIDGQTITAGEMGNMSKRGYGPDGEPL